jgi:hypothetical protein
MPLRQFEDQLAKMIDGSGRGSDQADIRLTGNGVGLTVPESLLLRADEVIE